MSNPTEKKSSKRGFQKFSDLRIRTKLLAIMALIIIVYLAIVVTVSISFQRIEKVLDGVISHDMNNVITNALTEQELSTIVADLNLVLNTFFEQEPYLEYEGQRLLEASRALASHVPLNELKTPLGNFISEMESLLTQCQTVNTAIGLLHDAENHLVSTFDHLDETIADKLIDATFIGDDVSILQQLSVLAVGYRQSLLEIGKLHAEHWPEDYYSPFHSETNPLLSAIAELDFRLRTLMASDSEIAGQGKNIASLLQTYKNRIQALNHNMVELKKTRLAVEDKKLQISKILQKFDSNIVQAIQTAKTKTLDTFRVAEITMIIISLALIVVLVVLTSLFFKNIIKKPMDNIRSGLEAFRHHNLDARIDLKRNDEWLLIEESLNTMAAELSSSYEDLKKAQSFVSNIINSMPSVLVGVDSEGRVTQWNLRAEQVTGTSAKKARFQPLNEVLPSLGHEMDRIKNAIRDRQVVKESKVLRSVHDERSYEDVTIYPLITNGVTGAVIRVDDVTELVEREEQDKLMQKHLEQTQRLESLGVLAGGIAHDFNNLLMAILGHADIALLKLPQLSSAQENLENIKTTSLRAADLCKQILAYSGQGKVIEEELSINYLVHEMIQMIQTSVSKKCHLNLKLAEQLPMIVGDYSQMQQILMNFVINASDAFDGNSGNITISTTCVHYSQNDFSDDFVIKPHSPGNFVILEVSDNGPGMDQATLERIFEPFFTTKFTGRGLGLSAVLGIVKSHNGGLSVHSTPDQGTTFTVYFPASMINRTEDPAQIEKIDATNLQLTNKVLLVDDEEMVLDVCKNLLEVIGAEVLTARDGIEAVEVYKEKQNEIDLVILDLTMPNMDGKEAFRILRQLNPEAKIVLASGYAEEALANQLGGEEPSGILSKPYSIANLTKLLADVLI